MDALFKVGALAGVILFAKSNASLVVEYCHVITLIACSILIILYTFGFKDNLKWVAALILMNVIIRALLGSYWGIPVTGELTKKYMGSLHHGIDIGIPEGTEVSAVKEGEVSKVWNDPIYGLAVMLDHGNGFQSLYAHNSKVLLNVGDDVSLGDKISLSGNTGKSTGPHLHFEIREGGKAKDPFDYISWEGVVGKYE